MKKITNQKLLVTFVHRYLIVGTVLVTFVASNKQNTTVMKHCIIIDKATDKTFCPFDGKFYGPSWNPVLMTKDDAVFYLDQAREICPNCEILEDYLTPSFFPDVFNNLNAISI